MELLSSIQTQAKQVTAPGSTLWEQPASVPEIKALLNATDDVRVLDGLRKLMAVCDINLNVSKGPYRGCGRPSIFIHLGRISFSRLFWALARSVTVA